MSIYLDSNATTPIDPEVLDVAIHYMRDEYGNAGSRTHEYGVRAKRAVDQARRQVAEVAGARPEEVVFTSGATESNNIALLGLARAAGPDKQHIISAATEHKAVLEPLEQLESEGFEVELLPCDERGWVAPEALSGALRADTLLVSLMHVNNETGVIQPVEEYVDALEGHDAYFHVDSAQGFGKDLEQPRSSRIDLLSVSGHKLFAPKGIGALIARRRGHSMPPIQPLAFGGGQERGLRPGTQPVHLIAALGKAVELAESQHAQRMAACVQVQDRLIEAIQGTSAVINGDSDRLLGNCMNISFTGADTEALMLTLKGTAAFSNGSACTSSTYEPSHVLAAMGFDRPRLESSARLSWSHLTPDFDWTSVTSTAERLMTPPALSQ